jgi:hypothetical protein
MTRAGRALVVSSATFTGLLATGALLTVEFAWLPAGTSRALSTVGEVLWYWAPLAGGVCWGYMTDRFTAVHFLTLAVVESTMVSALNLLMGSVGISDFPGVRSVPLVAVLSALVVVPLTAIGAGAGTAIRQRLAA